MSKQKPAPSPLSEHGLARLIVLIIGVLAWFALGAPLTSKAEARRFARYGAISIATLRKAVRNIIIIRAAELLARQLHTRTDGGLRRGSCRAGFRRRISRGGLRAIFGADLRRQLKHRGSFFEQAAHLLSILRDHRTFARRLAHLRRNLMTRLTRIIIIAPPAVAWVSLAAPMPAAHDSS